MSSANLAQMCSITSTAHENQASGAAAAVGVHPSPEGLCFMMGKAGFAGKCGEVVSGQGVAEVSREKVNFTWSAHSARYGLRPGQAWRRMIGS